MKAYLEAKQLMFRRNLTWAIMIGLALFVALALALLAAVMLFVA